MSALLLYRPLILFAVAQTSGRCPLPDAAAKLGSCLDFVRTVEGRLVYKGISSELCPCLRSLRKIDHSEDGPAIELENNKGLTSLSLHQVKEIKNKDKIVFKVLNDDYLTNTTTYELNSLVSAAGGSDTDCMRLFYVRRNNKGATWRSRLWRSIKSKSVSSCKSIKSLKSIRLSKSSPSTPAKSPTLKSPKSP